MSAVHGQAGTWLIDPNNITILNLGGAHVNINDSGHPWTSTADGAQVDIGLLLTSLSGGGTVWIQTQDQIGSLEAGNITVQDAINYDGIGALGSTLILDADNDICINGAIQTTDLNANLLDLSLNALGGISQTAEIQARAVVFNVGGSVVLNHASNALDTVSGVANVSIDIVDGAGDLAVAASGLDSGGGDISLATAGSLALDGSVNAGAANVDLAATGGTISGVGLVTADALTADSAGGIDLSAAVGSIEFSAAGNVSIAEADAVTVAGSTTANDGLIEVQTTAGTLEVGTFGAQTGLTADGAGNIALTAGGIGSDVLVGQVVTSGSGDIDVTAANGVGTFAKIETDGRVDVLAQGGGISIGGAIDPSVVTLTAEGNVAVNAAVQADDLIRATAGTDGTGSVNVNAGGSLETLAAGSDIVLSSGTTWADINLAGHVTAVDSVVLTADAGSIAQSAGTVAADSLAFSSGGSVTLANLAVSSATGTSMGDVALSNTGALDILGLDSGGGNVEVVTTLGLTASGLIDSLGGDVELSGQSVLLSAEVNAGVGDAVFAAPGGSIGGLGLVRADTLTADAATGIDLNTKVNSLDASVSGTGAIAIDEADGIELAEVDTAQGSISVAATTGNIVAQLVKAAGTITLDTDKNITVQRAGFTANLGLVELSGRMDTEVTLRALQKSAEYPFTGWRGDVSAGESDVNPLTLAMDQSRQVEATFYSLAAVYLSDLTQMYDGAARAVTATTMPAGLTVEITYNGSATAPAAAGSYAVTGTVNEANWLGSVADTLVIAKADQIITNFLPVDGAQFVLGSATTISGQASSGLAVAFENLTPEIANLVGTDITFTNAGLAQVRAAQAGDMNWNAATPVVHEWRVGGLITNVAPGAANVGGGIEVVIQGVSLGDGSDITNVTLAGVAATIVTQSVDEVTVTVEAAPAAATGDVTAASATGGFMVLSNGFEYLWLDAPTMLPPTVVTLYDLMAHWTGVPAATAYFLEVGLDAGFGAQLPGYEHRDMGAATNAPVEGLLDETDYWLRAFSWNADGLSLASPAVKVTTPAVAAFDFNADGLADLAVYHPATGDWSFPSTDAVAASRERWGWSAALPIPADYDGDGVSDIAVYHPAKGNWHIKFSTGRPREIIQFGWSATVPLPGDYDGDGKADFAVFHQAAGRWYFLCTTAGRYSVQWGWSTTIPVPADYDGDGAIDVAIYHPASGLWQILKSSTGGAVQKQWGWSTAIPVPADYDNDGKADIAVFHRATGTWRIFYSGGGSRVKQFGWSSTIPVAADYDGDGAADIAVYHPATGNWHILKSTTGGTLVKNWGWSATKPTLLYPLIHSWFRLP